MSVHKHCRIMSTAVKIQQWRPVSIEGSLRISYNSPFLILKSSQNTVLSFWILLLQWDNEMNTVLCDAATARFTIKGIVFIQDLFYSLLLKIHKTLTLHTVSVKDCPKKLRKDFKRWMELYTILRPYITPSHFPICTLSSTENY